MAGFLYFKPGCTQTVTLALVKEWGLGYAFTSGPSGCVCQQNTPNGGTGVVFADTNRLGDYSPIMDLDNQVWRKIPKSDCYVGMWKAAPPVPSDLERPKQLDGYAVPIGDYTWSVPLTAKVDESRGKLVAALPCYVECDADGNWSEGTVLDAYKRLWEVGQPYRDDVADRIMEGAEPVNFTTQELSEAATAYIQANYVVGPGELSLMNGLTNEATVQAAILAANDLRTFYHWAEQQKKSEGSAEPDGLTSASGEAA